MIRHLPPAVINQIAAGEVVERPASAVKELLENAIDAQATRIDLTVERGGKDLVRVSDNGVGMSPEDLVPAFQPHATSKLADADDLYRICTLGFRGEALAAIAEVSKIRCQTRQAGAASGSELAIDGGIFGAVKDCGCPTGTVIEVRNLFYNVPVRRTFLKSDTTENGHVVEMFARIALAHPGLHLTYRSGGRVVHDLPPVSGTRDRIAIFFGRELAESLLWVEGQLDDMQLWGYVAHPSQNRSTAKGQFLFLGGRYVRDRSLSHALNEAYRGLLMSGRMPVAFLHLDIPPDQVDVNVHPTKIEVRFQDSQRVYSHLLSTLRHTFLKSDLHARLQATSDPATADAAGAESGRVVPVHTGNIPRAGFDPAHGSSLGRLELTGGPSDRQTVASWFESSGSKPRLPDSLGEPVTPAWAQSLPLASTTGPGDTFDEFSPLATSVASAPPHSQPAMSETTATGQDPGADRPAHPTESRAKVGGRTAPNGTNAEAPTGGFYPERAAGEPPVFQECTGLRGPGRELVEPTLKAIQVHDSYLIAETGDGMMVIDQHALHERILYEELRGRVARGNVESQRLLVPEPVSLTASEAASLVEQSGLLARLGLEIEPFGGDTVLVQSIPAILPHVVPERLVRDLAEHLRTQPLPPTRDGLLAELLHMVACKAAVKAGQPLSAAEIAALLDRRHLVANSHHCPHGRPTALVFTKADLEKQFGRV
jgi:DNA mismatch repair protein MutL